MSSEVISPSKLLYSRDFLLRYSCIHKDDAVIAEKVQHILDLVEKANNDLKDCNNEGIALSQSHRLAKSPTNPKKSGNPQLYTPKDNIQNQVLSKSTGVDAYSSPSIKKGPLSPTRPARPAATKSSNTRKTWVAAVESDGVESSPVHSAPGNLQVVVSHSISTPDQNAFTTPVSSPNSKTPVSKNHTDTLSITNSSEANYLSPKSSSSTPFKSPTSPGGTRYSPSKSPRSPVRQISPLDEQRLAQRQKQIDYGYRTVGYLRYRLLVAKDHRKPEHPRTPKKTQGCSKRSWDGQLKKWRRDLHLWDPDNVDAFKALLNSDLVVSIIAANPELAEIVEIVKEKLDNPTSQDYEEEEIEEEPDYPLPQVPAKNGFSTLNSDKKVSPRIGDDTKIQNKVVRTLVF